jgi:translation initiation factor 2 alpha subunit (eIF-2alpha)
MDIDFSKNLQFYSNEHPTEGEIVLVQFTKKHEGFFDATLMEYIRYNGLMNFQDASKKRRISSWADIVPIGRNMAARVESVDMKTRIVQLSIVYFEDKEEDAIETRKKYMMPFNENKSMVGFITSFCIISKLEFSEIWTILIHYIDSERQEYNDDEGEEKSLWIYFVDNFNDMIDTWLEETHLLDVSDIMKELFKKRTEKIDHKITTKISIISLGGISNIKILLQSVLDTIDYEYNFYYDTTPNYIFETNLEYITDVNHKQFVEDIKKEATKFNPQIFIK